MTAASDAGRSPSRTSRPSRGAMGMFQNFFGNKRESASTDEDTEDHHEPLLIEICSCKELLVADKTGSSDPYVTVHLGKKQLHKTLHLEQTLNPTFTVKDKNRFLLTASPAEVAQHKKGLVFTVKDHDRFGQDDLLGTVSVPAKLLFAADYDVNGEIVRAMALKPPKTRKTENAGMIILKWRPATMDESKKLESTSKRFPMFGLGGKAGFLQKTSEYGNPNVHFLIDICGCNGLPANDITTGSSDPYVKVKLGDRDIHETKYISKTCDPIYTVKTDSLFILDVNSKELKDHGGITFKVKDYDAVGRNDELCTAELNEKTLLQSTGERIELDLETSRGRAAGKIAVRCRPATEHDRAFLGHIQGDNSDRDDEVLGLGGMDKAMKHAGGQSRIRALFKKSEKEEDGVKKLRIRPYPDPNSSHTAFLSEEEIESFALKESKKWMELGTGDLGRLFVEIIGCDGLPNKENDIARTGDKSDPFVTLVYEDGVAKTDIIDDCLSPRWMPWMQRAFIFRMMHPSSNLYLGVFDYDAGVHDLHDMCGHVYIDLANLRPDTEYLLHYNLYEDSFSSREAQGTITVRLRIELSTSEKALVLSNLSPPPEIYVNVKKNKDFRVIRQTVGGKRDFSGYNKDAIGVYLDEIYSYLDLKFYAFEAAISLLFWRGQVPFYGFHLPLHSLVVFLAMITIVETPSLAPTYFWYGIAWILLAAQTWRNKNPNPWAKSKSFMEIALALTGKSSGPMTVHAHQNEIDVIAYQEDQNDWILKAKADAQRAAEHYAKLMEEHGDVFNVDQTADTDISTKTGGVSLDPLKPILFPIQQYLAMVVKALRLIKNIFLWEEPYLAFFLAIASFVLGTVLLITPWVFTLRWLSRIIAWGLFGPHMKLVDVFWYSKQPAKTSDDLSASIRDQFQAQLTAMKEANAALRIQRETTQKLKAMKKVLFGKYITHVPVLHMERFSHIPLPSSSAKPFTPSDGMQVLPDRIVGQHLTGDMIPAIEEPNHDHTEYEDALGFSHKFKDE